MACPNCDHTMHNLNATKPLRIWWCPRCGTVKSESFEYNGNTNISYPNIISRADIFVRLVDIPLDLDKITAKVNLQECLPK